MVFAFRLSIDISCSILKIDVNSHFNSSAVNTYPTTHFKLIRNVCLHLIACKNLIKGKLNSYFQAQCDRILPQELVT